MDKGKNQPPRRRRVYRQPSPRQENYDDYDDYEYELDDEVEEVPRRPLPPRSPRPSQQRARKQRRVWPVLLTGCGLGVLLTVLAAAAVVFFAIHTTNGNIPSLPIISNTQNFSYDEKPTFPTLNSLTQLQICDKVGDVSIKVDPQAQTPIITAHKVIQATSKSAADQADKSLAIQVASPEKISNLSCLKSPAIANAQNAPGGTALTVNVSFPDNGGLVHANTNRVDLSIILPPSLIQSDGPTLSLDVEAPVGNITVDGLSGLLTILGGTGNVMVSNSALTTNSQINTSQGNVTFNGFLILPTGTNPSAHYFIRSEQGVLDVTLPSNTNVTLDANTNVGTITSDFPIASKPNSDGSVSYHGPLTSSPTISDSVVLVVDVSTGNIKIHQLQTAS
jgi:hypothetical protein